MTWPWSRSQPDAPFYVDTPAGILAADGTHYRTTEALLREYAGPVLEGGALGELLRRAGAWLRVPQTAAVLALPFLLLVMPWWGALGVSVLLYALWAAAAPGIAMPRFARMLYVLENPAFQGLVYIGMLSAFASSGQIPQVWAGVAGFVAFRLGVVAVALRPVLEAIWTTLYPLPVADQTLRSILVREALRRGVALPGMAEIEARVRSFWRKDK